ncbi:hypothetical protein BpHYR1_046462 [Brachionus plicatilis]|uniref:Uncharacterized protein n=1 Tax=Brachionus plicatilis TaxID=10195 RepID=A0A3M7Q8D6_BRAPC|nr:hypothetical protein BpHYR1_046462 [Brachionus plicatilis]
MTMRLIAYLIFALIFIDNSFQQSFSLSAINFGNFNCSEGEIIDTLSLVCQKCPANSSPTKDLKSLSNEDLKIKNKTKNK